MDSHTIADVEALLRQGIGDAGRLNHIKSMLQTGRELYNSDKKYLEMLQGMASEAPNPDGHGSGESADKPPSVADLDADVVQNARMRESNERPTRESIIIVNQSPRSSAAWYLLPIFLNILGGIISYFCLRQQDPPRARKTLILGIVLSIIPFLLLAGALWFTYDEYVNTTVPVTDLTEDQIRQSALQVSYTLLVEESDLYRGEIIEYEGNIKQVLDNFNSYVLRVDVSDAPSYSGSVWSNFDPKTDEEEEWVEELKRTQNPFDLDPDTVRIWGTFTGLRDHDTIFGATMTVPEVDVHLLERIQP